VVICRGNAFHIWACSLQFGSPGWAAPVTNSAGFGALNLVKALIHQNATGPPMGTPKRTTPRTLPLGIRGVGLGFAMTGLAAWAV
jgi:hypothetical protein